MKQIGLTSIYEWGLLVVLALIVVHAPLSVGFGVLLPDYEVVLKAWKEMMLTVLALIGVVLVTRRRLWPRVLRSWPLRLSFVFIGLHLLLAGLLGGNGESIVAGLMIDLRFIVMFILMYVLVLVQPGALQKALIVTAVGASAVLGFGVLQLTVLPDDILGGIGYSRDTITPFTTIDSNSDYVRINSTLRGPNPLGALAVVYAALALAYVMQRYATASVRMKIASVGAFVASVTVLFASYSRSAYVALAVALGVVGALSVRLSKRYVMIVGLALLVAVSGLALVSTTDWYSNVILHEDPESTVMTKSNDAHLESLADGAHRMATQPIGAGVGSTGSASLYDDDSANDAIIENYYFFVAHESGWLGLLVFVLLFGSILFMLWRRRSHWYALGLLASGTGLAVIGLLLPVWADETVSFVWWGLAGAAIASTSGIIEGRHATRTRKQKATGTP